MEDIQLSLFGKMCPELSAATEERISAACSKNLPKSAVLGAQYLDLRMESGVMPERSWETVSVSRGACSTHNTGECPKDARESTLSSILEANAPEKYYLSVKACKGILRRAERRGKELPAMLREALEEVISMNA